MRTLPIVAALLVGGCAMATAPAPSAASRSDICVARFQYFDVMEDLYPNSRNRHRNRVASPPVEAAAQRLREAGCISFSDEIAGMDTVASPPPSPPGAAIPPTTVHAGVVTNMADDAAARGFFEAHGIRARSIGSGPLGRRIYIGPFATEGALADGMALALAAGFDSPYPARF